MLNFGFMLSILSPASDSRKKYGQLILYFFLLAGIVSFYLPWAQMEFATGNAAVLPELALEMDGLNRVLAYLVYSVYLIPVLYAWLFWSLVIDVLKKWWIVLSVLNLIISLVFLTVLYFQTLSPEIHFMLKPGVVLNAVCSLVVVVVLKKRFINS
jgi:hypothetical protein